MTAITSTTIAEADRVAASAIAGDVHRAQKAGRAVTHLSVNALLNAFDRSQLDADARHRIQSALAAVGLEAHPSLDSAQQSDTLRITVLGPVESTTRPAGFVHARLLKPGCAATDVPVQSGFKPPADAVMWFDVDADRPRENIGHLLLQACPGLTLKMIDDLVTPDIEPKVCAHSPGIRSVSVVGVYAQQADLDRDVPPETKSGQLVFQLVETIAGPGWLVTCWHHSRICLGSTYDRDQAPVRREEVMRKTEWMWRQHEARTSSDLGTQLIRVLVDSFRRTHRQIEAWLQLWELDYFKHHAHAPGNGAIEAAEPETVTLSNLLSLVSEFRRRLAAFNNARSVSESGTWYAGVSDKDQDEQADAVLDRALKNLALLFENVRADMDLVTMNAISEQARAAADLATSVADNAALLKDQREADEAFQKQLGKVTALLLVPTLIAGIFGANTQLPGGGRWSGFEFMLVLMLVSSLGVYLYVIRGIRRLRPGETGRDVR